MAKYGEMYYGADTYGMGTRGGKATRPPTGWPKTKSPQKPARFSRNRPTRR